MKLNKTSFCAWMFVMALMLFSFSVPAAARWGDGTGPEGLGPQTGRGIGYCTGNVVPGFQNTTVPRLGLGRASFRGRGGRFRNLYNGTGLTRWQQNATSTTTIGTQQTITKTQQLDALKKQAELIKNELDNITRQIREIESEK